MRKISSILFVLAIMTSIMGFSQKVKVKKGKILVDGVEVAIIEATNKNEIKYVIKELSGEELLNVDVDIAEGSTRPFEFNWMTIDSKNYPLVNVVDYSMLSLSLSHPKIIAEILTKTYGIFSVDGLNKNKVSDFFAEELTSKFKEEATGSGGVAMKAVNEGFEGRIRVKGKDVLFDKSVVAKVKANNGKYTFTSTNSKEVLEVILNAAPLAGLSETLKWLVISDNQGRTTEVKMEYLSGNVQDSRAIAELLAEKYNVLTLNGIENLDKFFGVDRKNLTEEYRIYFNEAKEAYLKAQAQIKYRIEEQKLRDKSVFDDVEKGFIYLKEGDEQLGTVENLRNVYKTDDKFYVKVLDRFGGLIAKFTSRKDLDSKQYLLVGFDNKQSKVFLEGDLKFSKEYLYKSIVKVLTEKGYDFAIEVGVKRAKEIVKEKVIEEFFAKSKAAGNLRYAKGYMLFNRKKGVVREEGYITLYFKYIPIPEGVEDIEEGRIMNSNVDGKRLGTTFRFQQTKSIQLGILHKARDNSAFCIYLEDGGEKCYRGKKLGTAKYGFVETDSIIPQ